MIIQSDKCMSHIKSSVTVRSDMHVTCYSDWSNATSAIVWSTEQGESWRIVDNRMICRDDPLPILHLPCTGPYKFSPARFLASLATTLLACPLTTWVWHTMAPSFSPALKMFANFGQWSPYLLCLEPGGPLKGPLRLGKMAGWRRMMGLLVGQKGRRERGKWNIDSFRLPRTVELLTTSFLICVAS